jgi:hypothetical protein
MAATISRRWPLHPARCRRRSCGFLCCICLQLVRMWRVLDASIRLPLRPLTQFQYRLLALSSGDDHDNTTINPVTSYCDEWGRVLWTTPSSSKLFLSITPTLRPSVVVATTQDSSLAVDDVSATALRIKQSTVWFYIMVSVYVCVFWWRLLLCHHLSLACIVAVSLTDAKIWRVAFRLST